MTDENYVTFDPRIPKQKPALLKPILIIIAMMYIIEVFYTSTHGSKAIILLGAKWNEGITNGEYWRFFTCTLLHGNLMHLFLNLAALYIFGKELESFFGTFKFLIIYLFTAWGASLASYAFSPGIAVGASGVAFGILGCLISFFYKEREHVSNAHLRFKTMYTLAIINIIFGLVMPNIDNSAHIGGLVTGLIVGYYIAPKYFVAKDEKENKLKVFQQKDTTRVFIGSLLTFSILFWLTKLAV